ncbi:MAG: hypothetical protein RBU21_06205 [FCB group bacterium]|jgi:hypothetical protein|nr:hypothetical protein [FCB group bacterium]
MSIEGFVDYQRREYCKDIHCPIQVMLEEEDLDSKEHTRLRGVCQIHCLHTTYEFHHWLIKKGYLLVRPLEQK